MIPKKIPFYLLAVLTAILGLATFVEKYAGTGAAKQMIYHSGWFIALWTTVAVMGCLCLLHTRKRLSLPGALLHGSFVLILAGAFLTHLTSLNGRLHLRKGITENYFTAHQQRFWESSPVRTMHKLPFTLTLQEFAIATYPGTQAPTDYISKVTVGPVSGEEPREVSISMNRILRSHGYRFYQHAYDPDHLGTILAVNYDPFGVPVTYTGYALLVLSMILLLGHPQGNFRKLLRHPALKGSGFALFFLCLNTPAVLGQTEKSDTTRTTAIQTLRIKKKAVPENWAFETGKLQVLYGNRIVPLNTLAREIVLKVYGKANYRGYLPEQVVWGWFFYPEQWQYEPLIQIKNPALARLLETPSPAPLVAFFGDEWDYKLQAFRVPFQENPDPLQKALSQTDEKVQLLLMLEKGSLLKLFPVQVEGGVRWFSPRDSLPSTVPQEKAHFIRRIFPLLREAVLEENYTEAFQLIGNIHEFQQKEGGESLLSPQKIRAERLYHRFEPTSWLYRISLSVGLISGLFYLFLRSPQPRTVHRVMYLLLLSTFTVLTATVVLRSYVTGWLPMSNGYETLLFLSWLIQLMALISGRKIPIVVSFGFLLSGFSLLVSTLGQMDPQITPLMPVLHSPWLSLHVSLIMTSYALFACTFISAVAGLLFHFQRRAPELERLTVWSRLILYPAAFLLAAGIFTGAVWANVSWGSYWAWDPKEVWALISFLVYAFPMHRQSLPFFRNPFLYHVYMLFAFLSLLMTYFGVNYFLGGMHSYTG